MRHGWYAVGPVLLSRSKTRMRYFTCVRITDRIECSAIYVASPVNDYLFFHLDTSRQYL